MPDVFISYSSEDEQLARWLYKSCRNFKIDAFLASISIDAGTKWKQDILDNLRFSKWFFFLATPNSIKSDAVKHEIGGALVLNQNIIPILDGIDFKDLPDWIKDYQGIRIGDNDVAKFADTLTNISKRIKADKVKTAIIIMAIVAVLWILDSNS